MRRLVVLLAGIAVLAAGCGGGEIVAPTAKEVVGSLPQEKKLPPGNAAAGKTVYDKQGCGSCHTFKPAGSTQKIGPDLDNLAKYAQQANQGTEQEFVRTSIVNPSAYLQPGYQDLMPKDYGQKLSDAQLADLIAFLTKKS